MQCTHIWASGEDGMGVLAPEWEPCLPTSRQPPLQPPPQGLQGPVALAGSPTHPQNIWLGWAGLGLVRGWSVLGPKKVALRCQ